MRSGRTLLVFYAEIKFALSRDAYLSQDALTLLDSRCSGRHQCKFTVSDPTVGLLNLVPCPTDFSSYLEASYTCNKGERHRDWPTPRGPPCSWGFSELHISIQFCKNSANVDSNLLMPEISYTGCLYPLTQRSRERTICCCVVQACSPKRAICVMERRLRMAWNVSQVPRASFGRDEKRK